MYINLTLISSSLHNISDLSQKRMEVIEVLKALGDVSIFKNSNPASCCQSAAASSYQSASESSCKSAPASYCKSEPAAETLNIAYILTGGTESLLIKLFGENLSALGNIAIISDAYHNSLAASQEICTWLYNNGVQHKHIHIPLHNPDATLHNFPTLLSAESPASQRAEYHTCAEATNADALVGALSGCTIGLIGEASPWLIASGIDKEALSKRCGVSFREICIDTLAERYLKYRELWEKHRLSAGARAELDEVLCRFACSLEGDRTPEDLSDAAIMYLALASLCKQEHLDAVTVKCFDLLSSCKTTACLALALLNDNGIIAGCEGDIPSICTMLAVYKALDRPSFMANPASIDRDNLSIDFAHCTIPTVMVEGCTLPSHFESGIGIGINGEVPLGNYMLCKLSGKTLERSLICNGRLVKGEYLSNRCRTQVRFIFDSKAEFDAFTNARVGNHIILFKRG